jgi:CRP-like cAMP-binding protein
MTGLGVKGQAVRVLDVDRELGARVPDAELEVARIRSVARVLKVDRRCWDPTAACVSMSPRPLGLLMIEGQLLRRVCVGPRSGCELLGAGDVFRPWDEDGKPGPIPVTVNWQVLRPARVAVLDREFALRMAQWPSVYTGLMQRVATRSRRLAIEQAVTRLTSARARLLLLFWLMAERWGVVTLGGVVVTLPLTHESLGALIGCERPTVTMTLGKLAERGLLRRQAHGRWLMTNEALRLLREPDRIALAPDACHVDDRLEGASPRMP